MEEIKIKRKSIYSILLVIVLVVMVFFVLNKKNKESHALYNGLEVSEITNIKKSKMDLILNENFEGEKSDDINFEKANSNSVNFVQDPFSDKNKVVKMTLNPGDVVNNGHRVEMTNVNKQSPGDEMIYAYKFLIDRDYNESDAWQGIMQFHDQPDFSNGETWETYGNNENDLYPPIMMNYSRGKVYVVQNNKEISGEPLASAPVIKDAWNTVVIHIKNGYEDGFLKLYLNGDEITKGLVTGQTIYNDEGNYIKIGLYRNPEITTSDTIYIDDYSVYRL